MSYVSRLSAAIRVVHRCASRGIVALLVPVVMIPLWAISASASVPAPGYLVTDFATGFANSGPNTIGPIGLAFDAPGTGANLYVMNYLTGFLYKFGPGGGAATASNQVNATPLAGAPDGMTFSIDYAHLYVARQSAWDVVEIDPSDGHIIRVVAGVPCPNGLAADPLTSDLYVAGCGGIFRITPSSGAVVKFSPLAGDGLTFDPRDGTLYAAATPVIDSYDRSGNLTTIDPGPTASSLDGIALAARLVPGQAPFLFLNQNDGVISKVDLTTSPPTTTTVASSGSRGDFTTVGADGCLYATQTDRVVKVTNADGTCSLAPPDPAITAAPTMFSPAEGVPFSGPVASFSDADSQATASEYSATINWGDSTAVTSGTISQPGGPGSAFTVSGNHTYSDEGNNGVTVTITDTDTSNNAATATSTVKIVDASLSAGPAGTLTATEGSTFLGPFSSFNDANPAATAADFKASIDWGDGSTGTGTVNGPTAGLFTVTGSHTFAEEGSYNVKVSMIDDGGNTANSTATATVGDAALVSATAPTIYTTNPVSAVVATFTDADPVGTASDYTATINWGDGSSVTQGTVAGPNGGPFVVSGMHGYPSTGPFSYTVMTHTCDVGGSCVDTTTTLLLLNMTGDAFAAKLTTPALGSLTVAEAGPVDTAAATTTSNAIANVSGPIVSGSTLGASVSTAVNPDQSSAQATATSLTVGLLRLPAIKVAVAQANSQTSCSASTGTASIASLTVGGVLVASGQAAPNTMIIVRVPLGALTIVLNQQVPVPGGLRVSAVHITGPLGLDLVIASATSDIHNCP